ncbi:MAG TPA: transcription termination factor Rho, partial [Oceanithermus sp.]|nr:transcription termination factor Rho [Oceanithermus sp.]
MTTRTKNAQKKRTEEKLAKLSFQELSNKILPELHLIAAKAGIENYKRMKKDELVMALLEREAEGEGLQLAKGYLEISPDGYGFLQESAYNLDSRSVIVSAGLIKQFALRSGDYVVGRARAPRENERYGTLIRVEAVNGLDPEAAKKRPKFDELIPQFPDQKIKLETDPAELAT